MRVGLQVTLKVVDAELRGMAPDEADELHLDVGFPTDDGTRRLYPVTMTLGDAGEPFAAGDMECPPGAPMHLTVVAAAALLHYAERHGLVPEAMRP
jgi:hypothetical protein